MVGDVTQRLTPVQPCAEPCGKFQAGGYGDGGQSIILGLPMELDTTHQYEYVLVTSSIHGALYRAWHQLISILMIHTDGPAPP